VTYTPSVIGTGTHNITASYGGDTTHATSNNNSSPFALTVTKRSTSTSINCSPSSVIVNAPTTCTATVTDTDAGTASAPSGTVTWGIVSGDGAFAPASCTLSSVNGSSSSCSSTYTPMSAAATTLSASYGGDGTHAASSDTTYALNVLTFSMSNQVGTHTVTAQSGQSTPNVPIFTVASPPGMQPGDQTTGVVTITNSGTASAALVTLAESHITHSGPAGSGDLSSYLNLTIVDCGRVDSGHTPSCSPGTQVYNDAFDAVNGPLTLYGSSGVQWVAGEAHEYQFTLSFVSHGDATDNQYQGTTASAEFDWTATSQ
jgi:hypothetical protein